MPAARPFRNRLTSGAFSRTKVPVEETVVKTIIGSSGSMIVRMPSRRALRSSGGPRGVGAADERACVFARLDAAPHPAALEDAHDLDRIFEPALFQRKPRIQPGMRAAAAAGAELLAAEILELP